MYCCNHSSLLCLASIQISSLDLVWDSIPSCLWFHWSTQRGLDIVADTYRLKYSSIKLSNMLLPGGPVPAMYMMYMWRRLRYGGSMHQFDMSNDKFLLCVLCFRYCLKMKHTDLRPGGCAVDWIPGQYKREKEPSPMGRFKAILYEVLKATTGGPLRCFDKVTTTINY